jgi:hypothetical protein
MPGTVYRGNSCACTGNLTNERLKLIIINRLGVIMNQRTDVGAYLEATKFTGTP